MAVQRYLDFDLCIVKTDTGYRAQVVDSPAGESTLDFQLPFSALQLENFVLKMGGRRRVVRGMASPELDAAREFGGKLFQTVFDNEVRGCLHSSMLEAERQGAGLRLRLRLEDAPELADLPWEFLYNPDRGLFLTLSAKTPLVRYLELSAPPAPLTVKPPLQMLVIVSSPSDFPPLDVEHEWTTLTTPLADFQQRGVLRVVRMENATLPELQRRLRAEPFHILHFIGHGTYDERTGDGALIFEDERGRGAVVSGNHLGTILHDYDSLRLAVLNACEGARSSAVDPFAGTAQSLVRQGLPAVIAMQFEVSDTAAISFAREFYGALAERLPVDAAVAEARKAVYAEGTGVEWGTPVLYLRAADGAIFDLVAPEAAPPRLYSLPGTVPPTPAPPPSTPVPAPAGGPTLRTLLQSSGSRVLTWIGGAAVLALLAVGAFFFFSGTQITCRVVAPALNLRSGPSTEFVPPVRVLASGTVLVATGRVADTSWLQVSTDDGASGWVGSRAEVLTCDDDLATLPIMVGPSAPPVAVTETAAASTVAKQEPTVAPSTSVAASAPAPTAPAGLPLTASLPRSTRYSSLVFTVDEARISSAPPEGVFAPTPVAGPQAFAILTVTIFNPLPGKVVAVAPRQVKLQLANGQVVDDLRGWSGAVEGDATVSVVYVYPVPAATVWEGTKLLIRVPGKEPAVLALDGTAPQLPAPAALPAGGSASAEKATYRILAATLDPDENGERANAGERFLHLRLRVINNDTATGGMLVASNLFRLIVDEVPLAPINEPSTVLNPQSAKEVPVVFVVAADATRATLQVGPISGATAPIALSLDPAAPTPTPAPTVASCSGDVGTRFVPLFRENVKVRVGLGCATGAQHDGRVVVQRYEHGRMIWLEETDTIYALLDPDAGTYRVYSPAATAAFADPPAADRAEAPVRGFGRVYFGADEVRAALGASQSIEVGVDAQLQTFQHGLMLFVPAHDGEAAMTIVGLSDGSFIRFPAQR